MELSKNRATIYSKYLNIFSKQVHNSGIIHVYIPYVLVIDTFCFYTTVLLAV